ncbi:DUF2393 family protein [Hydrogenimonas urashimensis]|uniref:DUF2393 family protein n=1 Tax=Hydrogenimonas urashimensis TaxID=2740515 RepID=UPI001F386819|nr:DUF2393 family protein [Hydrogenimonas urashimensis]
MTELLKHYLFYTFHSMTKFDVMAIGWILFLALLLVILAIFTKKRSFSYFLLFLGLLLLFIGPPAIKFAMDGYMRAADVTIERIKTLNYSHSLVVEGTVKNSGKIDFSSCDLLVLVYRPTKPLGRWAAYLKPLKVHAEHFGTFLERGASKPFRIIVDHFRKSDDFNVTVQARCYP